MAKKGLKRGLDHLFEDNNSLIDKTSNNNVEMILINDITPNPYQPRKEFDEVSLNELSESIKENGVFQPILVRQGLIGYELIAGERRFRASKLAGLKEIPAIIYDYDDKQMMEVALVENIQREDLNIVEEAMSYDLLIKNLEYTQEDLAKKIGKSRSHITNVLRILNLNEGILKTLKENKLSLGHAKLLVGIKDLEKQDKVFKNIIENNLSVRDTEKLIKEPERKEKIVKKGSKTNFKQIEELMIDKLSTKVVITGKDKGQIKIEYSSVDDLERLLDLLSVID